MSYASLDDVLARMGKLRGVVGNNDAPDEAEIDRFLEDLSGSVDAILGTLGATVPITEATAVAALRPVIADAATVLALEGAFPGDDRPAAATDLIDRISARRDLAWRGLTEGTSPIILLVESEATASGALGASSFWTDEPGYGRYVSPDQRAALNPALAPRFETTETF